MGSRLSRALALDALRVRTEKGNIRSTAESVRCTAEEILPKRFEGYVEESLFSLGAINRARKAFGRPLKPPKVGLEIYSALMTLATASRAEGRLVQHIPTPEPGRTVPAFAFIPEEAELCGEAIPELSLSA